MRKKSVWWIIIGAVLIFICLTAVGVNRLQQGVVILHYHSISDVKGSGKIICLNPKEFAWQMGYLKKAGYHPVTLEKAVDYLKNGGPLPTKAVAITFDDGYEDNLTNAFPVLRRFNYPAAIFIVTGEVGGTNSWDRSKMPTKSILNWAQIETMQKSSVSFQAHTVHHVNISRISEKQAEYELSTSKKVLERHLNKAVDYFAYPFGSLNGKAVARVRQAGFKAAFTSSPGANVYQKTDIFRIRRMPVKNIHGGFWGRRLFAVELKLGVLITYIENI